MSWSRLDRGLIASSCAERGGSIHGCIGLLFCGEVLRFERGRWDAGAILLVDADTEDLQTAIDFVE